ncbi:MAG TPA: EamA family transporter [Pseudolysinimonas sp.]|jgi:drug/metabolite transporter (DMT)-like permease|nr:EamA family transporter [Pseudolysinimonas sp.]
MLVVVIGLVCAVVYGAGDYFGGFASRRIAPVRVVALAGLVGLSLLAVASVFVGGVFSGEAVLWGMLSGVAGSMAILTLYWALAIGPMSILSPLTAVISAIVPLGWGVVLGERLSPVGYVALGIALVAVVLVGFVPEKGAVRPSVKGVVLASTSGLLIGVLLILLHAAPADSGLLPLVFNRVSYLLILWTIVLVLWLRARRGGTPFGPPARVALWPIVAAGLADATANTLLIVGFRLGELSVVAVLTALYPAGTIALAAIFLKERIAPVQWVGLALALVAAAMLALA